MASITKIVGKKGISFKIMVAKGRDVNGKQIRHCTTWKPDRPMTDRQMQKAVEQAAFEFEKSINQGFLLDNKQTFASYAEYFINLKEQEGLKHRTINFYKELLKRINQAIGHIKLSDLRPQHLNAFYQNLGEHGIANRTDRATPKSDILCIIKEKGLSKEKLSRLSGVSSATIWAIFQGKTVLLSTAEAVSKSLDKKTDELFVIKHSKNDKLSDKTINEHHSLIHNILSQAEKEMLVPFNAADKVKPPKVERKNANYFQPEDVARIFSALEQEPLKWKVITHLLIITGARRGEVMGLRWNKIDFNNNQIRIDTNLLYAPDRGIYEDTVKTKTSVRLVKLPSETMELLREYQLWYNNLRQKNGERWNETNFLFVQDNGKPMSPDSVTTWLRKFSERHELPHINPHAFRHTSASVLINKGTDIVTVSKRLGHATTSTTLNVYAHILEDADENSSETLADALLRSKKSGEE